MGTEQNSFLEFLLAENISLSQAVQITKDLSGSKRSDPISKKEDWIKRIPTYDPKAHVPYSKPWMSSFETLAQDYDPVVQGDSTSRLKDRKLKTFWKKNKKPSFDLQALTMKGFDEFFL